MQMMNPTDPYNPNLGIVTWVTLEKCCDLIGFTKDQINALRTRGKIRQDVHWVKRNGRIFINLPAIQRWIEAGS